MEKERMNAGNLLEKMRTGQTGVLPMSFRYAVMAGTKRTPEKLEECCCRLEGEADMERYVEKERERFRGEWFGYLRENGEEDLYY